jgi:hypothetical protein
MLVPDSRGRMGDFISAILNKIEEKIKAQIRRRKKSVDFQLFETLKIIIWKCEIDRSYHFLFLFGGKKCKFPKYFGGMLWPHLHGDIQKLFKNKIPGTTIIDAETGTWSDLNYLENASVRRATKELLTRMEDKWCTQKMKIRNQLSEGMTSDRWCRCATAQRAQCADEIMRTLEKPDSFASELFLDQLNLLESRK